MRKLVSALVFLMLYAVLATGQSRSVTGQVRDEKGDPVPFVTVKIKGSKAAVAADKDGNFSINVPPNALLTISAAGFETIEISSGTGAIVTPVLRAQNNLQEVVITALGIKRNKNELGYAAQQVTGDEVSKNRSSNFVANLSG